MGVSCPEIVQPKYCMRYIFSLCMLHALLFRHILFKQYYAQNKLTTLKLFVAQNSPHIFFLKYIYCSL
jgi:hypothetical protein